MKQILAVILLLLLFSGCSSKKEIIYNTEVLCYELIKVEIEDEVNIRVYKDDLALFKARSSELHEAIGFYEDQIDLYIRQCNELKDKWEVETPNKLLYPP